jgi:hypothetical protein
VKNSFQILEVSIFDKGITLVCAEDNADGEAVALVHHLNFNSYQSSLTVRLFPNLRTKKLDEKSCIDCFIKKEKSSYKEGIIK